MPVNYTIQVGYPVRLIVRYSAAESNEDFDRTSSGDGADVAPRFCRLIFTHSAKVKMEF